MPKRKHRVPLKIRLRRYAKQSVRKLSERINRNRIKKIPLEPVNGWPAPKVAKPRKKHLGRMAKRGKP